MVDRGSESAGPWSVEVVGMAPAARRRVLGRVGLVLVGRLVDGRLLVGLLGRSDAHLGLLARPLCVLALGQLLPPVGSRLGGDGGDEADESGEADEEQIAFLTHRGTFRAVRVHDLV